MKRFGNLNSHIANRSVVTLWLEFLLAYTFVALFFAAGYKILPTHFPQIFSFSQGEPCWSQAIYFSFVTQLTIGYGDWTPSGWCQFLAVSQAIIGVGFFGVWAGLAVVKFFNAPSRSIHFTPWAGYDLSLIHI